MCWVVVIVVRTDTLSYASITHVIVFKISVDGSSMSLSESGARPLGCGIFRAGAFFLIVTVAPVSPGPFFVVDPSMCVLHLKRSAQVMRCAM